MSQIMWRNMLKVIYSLQLHISHEMRSYSSAKIMRRLSYACFFGYLGNSAIWGNLARILQIMHWDTLKVIKSLQLLVPHQIRLYFSVRALCRLSYTCFTGTQLFGKFYVQGHMKNNLKSSNPHFTSSETLI